MNACLIIGMGYSAAAITRSLVGEMPVSATIRRRENYHKVETLGARPILFDGESVSAELADALATTTHLLISAPPGASGDPLLLRHRPDVLAAPRLGWIGYLSTVGVYGNHDGRWVDETTMPQPNSARARQRLGAEADWQKLAQQRGTPVQIFRLGGIYGPGRNTLVALADASQRRIVKPGQVFNRIHVQDIAGMVLAGMAHPQAGPVLNGVDDEPAAPQDVVVYAAGLMGRDPPPAITLDEADLSPMGRSFYAENKRVSNRATKAQLDYRLLYPTYREGLAALAAQRDWEKNPPPDA
ncbi:SDR family oxidoreductase [Candidatus Raskinella chloraquaticus]|jgi:hypothetical protein|uniref:NAD-dependent epimerase/dehydratase domain-containing protein n=1 Tax=Candidatus Raskinella chloraquaticus TaxID=1951219 RepID=A0A1W9HWH9_9HYPH|nr:MAG: hypothetical protein A4S15_10510 [Proteobacteria bacterium SG_bin8]